MLKTRLVAACLAVLGTAAIAHADTGMLPNGATITWDRLFIVENGERIEGGSTPDALRRYLNLAHCTCSQTNTGEETAIEYEVSITAETGTNRPGEVWLGTQCDNDELRDENCRPLADQNIGDIDDLFVRPGTISLPLYQVINGTDTMGACQQREGDAFAWILVDSDGDTVYDYTTNKSIGSTDAVQGIDTQPPPVPTNFAAAGGEGSIDLTWDAPTSNETDVFAYQAFCARAEDDSAPREEPPARRYDTTATVCDIPQELALARVDITGDGAPVDAPLPAFANLDEAFLCGDQPSGTATSITLTGLENGVAYKVALIAVDFYGNPSGVYFSQTVTPKPVTDLWEDLQDRNSKVEGGCLSSANGGGGLVLGLLVAMPFVLRRRRRTTTIAAGALATGLVGAAAPAHADDFTPYWEASSEDSALTSDDVTWHVGVRVGPYIPDIDIQAGLNAVTKQGPYEAMFGDWYLEGKKHERAVWQILPMLDVDRIIWDGFGHVGVGGSIGYMQKTAHAYLENTNEDQPERERSRSSKTKFRLIPLAATLTYRFTYADERYGIPLVPYLRGGLSYYMWEIQAPDGNTSKVCSDGTETPGCATNDARGASFGYQGAIGLSIRAERIDADAAQSMRAGGIQHAGFYAEYSYAQVDGFGSETKLSVGDTTWFAGVDFEF